MPEKLPPRTITGARRRAVRVSTQELVETSRLDPDHRLPLLVTPTIDSVDVVRWASGHRGELASWLLEHGAVLFRGFDVDSVEDFRAFTEAVSPGLLEYRDRAAPRIRVSEGVYTSTEFPPDHVIPLHHEMAYAASWPRKLFFYCDQPAAEGGRTPLTDDREVFREINPEVRREFVEKGLMYVRNYGEGVDMSWREAFQTDDRSEIEDFCRQAGIEVDWRGDRLRTRAYRKATTSHPETGDTVWFNHAHLFHISNVEPATRQALLEQLAEDELPRNAFFGDGSPIPAAVLDDIREIYERSAVRFPWQRGDVLVVDNVLASHGRESFKGPRKILVAMSELHEAASA